MAVRVFFCFVFPQLRLYDQRSHFTLKKRLPGEPGEGGEVHGQRCVGFISFILFWL